MMTTTMLQQESNDDGGQSCESERDRRARTTPYNGEHGSTALEVFGDVEFCSLITIKLFRVGKGLDALDVLRLARVSKVFRDVCMSPRSTAEFAPELVDQMGDRTTLNAIARHRYYPLYVACGPAGQKGCSGAKICRREKRCFCFDQEK